MPKTKASPAELLHSRMVNLLNQTQADKHEVTEILIAFLAIQIASTPPMIRMAVWDAAVDTLDDTVEELSEQLDQQFSQN